MKAEKRQEIFEEIQGTNREEALKDVINGLIDDLKEEALDSDSMAEVKGSKFAIEKLESLKRQINVQEDSGEFPSLE